MIIHTNILTGPVLLAVWAIDVYLFLACLRLIMARFAGETAAAACRGLRIIIDPLPNAIGRWLASMTSRQIPAWLPWLVLILLAVLVRQIGLWLVLTGLS